MPRNRRRHQDPPPEVAHDAPHEPAPPEPQVRRWTGLVADEQIWAGIRANANAAFYIPTGNNDMKARRDVEKETMGKYEEALKRNGISAPTLFFTSGLFEPKNRPMKAIREVKELSAELKGKSVCLIDNESNNITPELENSLYRAGLSSSLFTNQAHLIGWSPRTRYGELTKKGEDTRVAHLVYALNRWTTGTLYKWNVLVVGDAFYNTYISHIWLSKPPTILEVTWI
jgi:hypothetical protein